MEVNKMQVAGKGIKQEIKTGVSHRMMEVNKMQVTGKGIKQEIKTGVSHRMMEVNKILNDLAVDGK